MTLRRLDWALRARGTGIAGWPEAERDAALALLHRCPSARAVLADALAREEEPMLIDGAADGVPGGCPLARMQAGLRCAVLQLPPLPFAVRWSLLVACTAAGLYIGISAVVRDAAADSADAFAAVQSVTVASRP